MLPNICDIQPNKLNTNMKSKFFFFYGEQGTWKTTVASNFPRPLLAGFEIGYQFIDGIHAIPMSSWSDMKDLYRQLKTPAAKEKYDTIIFDTISGAYQLCYKYVLGQFGVNDPGEVPFGKGWRTIREEFSIIKEISKLGYGLVFIAHGKEQEIVDQKTKESHTKVKIDLDSSAANIVAELSDFVFYVRKEIDEDGIEKVFGYSALPNIETKRRLPDFPTRFLFTYDNILQGMETAIAARKEKGAEVTDVNLHIVEEVDWTETRDEVIGLVKKLLGTAGENEATRYITEIFPGIRLSETTALHKDKLIAARDYLSSLVEKLGL